MFRRPQLPPTEAYDDKLRPYQRELLEQACLQDGMVTLPTGAGKTMIAARLAARQLYLYPDKWVFFVVNRTPLVDQQRDALQAEMNGVDAIGVLGGRKSVSSFEKIKAMRHVKAVVIIDSILYAWIKNDPTVLTRHASLVIFDEAHHCTGGFYNKLMDGIHKLCPRRHLFNLPPRSRETEQRLYGSGAERRDAVQRLSDPDDCESVLPKILCLSASPATDFSSIEKRVMKLLDVTQCRLLSVHREVADMKRWILSPMMLSVNFYPREEEGVLRRCFLEVVKVCFKILKKACLQFEEIKKLPDSLQKVPLQSPQFSSVCDQSRISLLTKVLPKYGNSVSTRKAVTLCEKSLHLLQVMGECLVALEDFSIDEAFCVFMRVYAETNTAVDMSTTDASLAHALITPLVGQVRRVLRLYAARGLCGEALKARRGLTATCQSSSTRIALLMKVLEDVSRSMSYNSPGSPTSNSSAAHSHSHFRGIIFVSTRRVAETVIRFMQDDAELAEKYMPALFVGQGSTGGNAGMTRAQQSVTLDRFREGEHRLLVATTVAEEGIDVPNCNVVIQFDPVYSLRSIVQSRGRARKSDSLFVTFTNMQYARSRLPQIVRGISNQDNIICEQARAQTTSVSCGLAAIQRNNADEVWDCNAIRLTLWLEDTYSVTVQVLEELVEKNGTRFTEVTALVSLPPIDNDNHRSLVTRTMAGNRKNARRSALAQVCEAAHGLGYFPPVSIHDFVQSLNEESGAGDDPALPTAVRSEDDDEADEVGDSTTRGIVLPVYRITADHILCTTQSRAVADLTKQLVVGNSKVISRLDECKSMGSLLFDVLKKELRRHKLPAVKIQNDATSEVLQVELQGEICRTGKELKHAADTYRLFDTDNVGACWQEILDRNRPSGDCRYSVWVEAAGDDAVGTACLVFLQLMGASLVFCKDAILQQAMVKHSMYQDIYTSRVLMVDHCGL